MKEMKVSAVKGISTQGIGLRIMLVLFDVVAVNISYLATLILRYFVDYKLTDKALAYVDAFWQFAPYYTVFCLIVFACFRLYSSMWKFAGMQDLNRIILANLVTAIGYVVGTLLFTKRMTISYYIIGAAIQVMLVVAIRFFPKILSVAISQARNRKAQMNAMIVGVGETSQLVRARIENDTDNVTKPVCYLTSRNGQVNLREKLLRWLFGEKKKVLVIAPGDSVFDVEIHQQDFGKLFDEYLDETLAGKTDDDAANSNAANDDTMADNGAQAANVNHAPIITAEKEMTTYEAAPEC